MLIAEKSTEDRNDARYLAGRRSTLVSIVVNVILTMLQVLAGWWSGSQALIADGVHSLSDLIADFVVLLAAHQSRNPADAEHQYGHQRFETAASLALGALLLAVGVGMLAAAFIKLHTLSASSVQLAALWVALASLVAKELLFRYMLRIAERVRSSMLVANAWHARSDAVSSLVVLLGIGGNLLGFPLLDPIAALIVGLMIVRTGWNFFWQALNDLMDKAVSVEESQAIRHTLLATPGVFGVHDLRTRRMGDMTIVDVHLELDGNQTVSAGHAIANLARQRVMAQHAVLDVMTHVDPFLQDTGDVPAMNNNTARS
jgi:cation diffusion facilitator family transporter